MATPYKQLDECASKLIKLEEDLLINENVAVSGELESTRSEFQQLASLAVKQAISEELTPDVYKVWFQKLHDDLCRAAGNLSCTSLAGIPPEFLTEFRDSEFASCRNRFVDSLSFFREHLAYDLQPDRKQLRLDITFGREFPETEFLKELLRAFGPLDLDLDATANRLLPYYPMPEDVSAVILDNASKEKPTEKDWFILLFALADHAAMAFHVKPTLEPDFVQKFDSEHFFDKFREAIYSASVVTPGFTGLSLPDSHEKLDKHAILEIRSWAAERLGVVRITEAPRSQPTQSGQASNIKPRGVSLRDVAALLNDGDTDAIQLTKKRWWNSRDPKLPASLGKCSADNRSGLYAPSAILEFVKKVESRSDADISALRQQLHSKVRPVRD